MTLTADQINACRRQFPALARSMAGMRAAYFDGPAGTQVPHRVIEAMSHYLAHTNSNHGGAFAVSRESDHLLDQAHRATADFLGTDDPECVIYGQNMTSLTFVISRALARTWKPGDEILVTRLDHDANFTPWALAARDAGAVLKIVDFHKESGTLNLEDFRKKLSPRTKLAAFGAASNASGAINPVRELVAWAKEAGALTYVDAVHYAPHGLIDVTAWDCDFLACSAYKFFGPHLGILYGKREHLERLEAYKVRPAPDSLPGKWMTGTQSHESIAGTLAAIEYLADLGREACMTDGLDRRAALAEAFARITAYEATLTERLLAGLRHLPEVTICGPTDAARLHERVPTFSLRHARRDSAEWADALGKRGFFVWHGNFYAKNFSETLGYEPSGMVRLGAVHYNTLEEIEWLLEALAEA